jgi:hypothetical protein
MATIGKELASEILQRLGFAAGKNIRSCIDRINEELASSPDEETKQLLEEYKEDFRSLMIQAYTIMGKLSADSEDPQSAQGLIRITREICGGAG